MVAGTKTDALRIGPVAGTASIVQTLHSASSTAAVPNITFIGDNNTGMYRVGADAVGITTNGTKRMEINNTDVEISTGNILFETASKGIYLGTTSAVAANHLQDYEEGVYDVAITCATSGTYGLNSGYDSWSYTKVGRLVMVYGTININSESSPTGQIRFSLPFTVLSIAEYQDSAYTKSTVLAGHADSDTNTNIVAWVEGGTAIGSFYQMPHGGGTTGTFDETDVYGAWSIIIMLSFLSDVP